MDFNAIQNTYLNYINAAIQEYLPNANTHPQSLHEAMLYALQAGGKRLRPTLLLAAFDVFQNIHINPFPAAVAIECIHTYSLIHDDLPCLDNADLRRGMPATHIKFGEAIALLAGDALLTYPFELLAFYYPNLPQLTLVLANAAGSRKLISGQVDDITFTPTHPNPENALLRIYANKTAALISASLKMGFIMAGAPENILNISEKIAYHMGLSYQIIDDVLDETTSSQILGKPIDQTTKNNTLTYSSLYGVEAAKEHAKYHTEQTLLYVQQIDGDTSFIQNLINQLLYRIY